MNDLSHPATLSSDVLLRQCDVQRTRRSGPGGQHRNKVETAVVVTHQPTGTRAEASERRSQAENLAQALRRLRLQLALDHRAAWRQPSPMWRNRSRNGRLSIATAHEEFAAMLAEALDALADCEWEVAEAARLLAVSSSQLVRFLKKDPRGLAMLNQRRGEVGLSPLR